MNNSNQAQYEKYRLKVLEEKWYTDEMFTAFRRNMNKNIDPNEADKLGQKLIQLISKKGYSDLDKDGKVAEVTELIFAGANLEMRSQKYGDTPIIICAKKNYYPTFSLLVRGGANINAQSNYLSTATMWSARKGHQEILEDLLVLKADTNIKCQDGDTALHSAVKHNQVKSVTALINSGVVLNMPNNLGLDVLNIAREKGNTEIVNILASAMNVSTQFVKCTEETVQKELKLARKRLNLLRK